MEAGLAGEIGLSGFDFFFQGKAKQGQENTRLDFN